MTGYTKLFGSIVTSTIWREKNETRILWITMLALKDKHGVVEGSIPGLADMARLSVEDTVAALEVLRSPDPYSRTKENEGRRIEDVEGGWLVINHNKWRDKMSMDERREYLRIKKQESRARKSTPVNKRQQKSTESTHTYTDTYSNSDKEPPSGVKGGNGKFIPPELNQWLSLADQIGYPRPDAEQAFHSYSAKGWMVGSSPMKQWKSAIQTCFSRWKQSNSRPLENQI